MLKQLLKANRRRVPVKYAVIAAVFAALSVAALETAGKSLTNSYSGLGGRLGGGPAAASPAVAPIK